MSFGGFYGPTSEADSMRALARALDLGVDFLDTADVYGDGLCEHVIGKFLAEDKSRRARVTLATKFAIRRRDDGARFFDNSAAHIREALDGSRKRLGVDHIDLYYVHRVEKSIPIEDTVEELARLVKAGAIGAIGLSEVAPDTLRRAHDMYPIAAVQSEYSLWTRNPELGLIHACAELGAILVAFSPLARGYLSGLLQDVESLEIATPIRGCAHLAPQGKIDLTDAQVAEIEPAPSASPWERSPRAWWDPYARLPAHGVEDSAPRRRRKD